MSEVEIAENITEVLRGRASSLPIFSSGSLQHRWLEFALLIILSAIIITFVTALLKDILFPPLSMVLSSIDVPDWKLVLSPATTGKKEISIKIGDFIETAIMTLIVGGIAVMILIKLTERSNAQVAEDVEEKKRLLQEVETKIKRLEELNK